MNARANRIAQGRPARSLWPYAIAGYFLLAICGMAAFITWAVRQNMDLVRPDYYEHEMLFQKQIEAVNRTQPFAHELAVSYDAQQQSLLLRVPPTHVGSQFHGTAHLYRPSDARLDRRIELKPALDGTQVIEGAKLAPGLWKVRLDWTFQDKSFAFEQSIVIDG
jgi:nitrogen fixation protein FixH